MIDLKSKIWLLGLMLFLLASQITTIMAQEEVVETAESGPDGSGTLILIIGLAAVVAVGFFASIRENEGTTEGE